MNDEDRIFLLGIKEYITKRPEICGYISEAVTAGITEALEKSRRQASDMEIALANSLYFDKKLKKQERNFIKDTLIKYEGKTYCRWDWFFKEQQTKELRDV